MEAAERPSKIRKISHNQEMDSTEPPNGSSLANTISGNHNMATSEGVNAMPDLSNQPSEQETDTEDEETKGVSNTQQTTISPSDKPLSKNQLKKLRKREKWDAGKDFRKAKRKEKAKEKRERQRSRREEEIAQRIANGEPAMPAKHQHPVRLPVTFLIDCAFDDKMEEKERISLGAQLTRAYSDNSKAPYQAHLVVSSWGGHLRERFDNVLEGQYRNWRGIEFVDEDFVAAAEKAKAIMAGPRGGTMDGMFKQYASNITAATTATNDDDNDIPTNTEPTQDQTPLQDTHNTEEPDTEHPTTTTPTTTIQAPLPPPPPPPTPLPPSEIIYLTSDSPNTLTHLSPHSTYIIGGIVDKNRHKGLCYRIARDRDVQTAKLPISEFMEMQSRFVLATNHVVDIMIRWLECGDWGESFMKVIPKRKGGKLKGKQEKKEKEENGGEVDVGDGDDDVDEDGDEDDGPLSG